MKKFYDEETGLTFVGYSQNDLKWKFFLRKFNKQTRELNNWTYDKGVQTYIVDNRQLGEFFNNMATCKTITPIKQEQYFIFEENKLIGSAIIQPRSFPLHMFLSQDDVKEYPPIKEDNSPLIKISYLVTNPEIRGKGYGTRIIKGIINNEQIIAGSDAADGIVVEIHNENEASQKAFLKNNFVVLPASCRWRFKTYYTGNHSHEFNNQQEN